MIEVYFAEIPVYRVPHDQYFADRAAFAERELERQEAMGPFVERLRIQALEHWKENYGGGWRYNEITHFIRLYILGTQIRGELWKTQAKRIVKSRTKKFVQYQGKFVSERELPLSQGNPAISDFISQFLDRWEEKLAPRYVDRSAFQALLPYIDWGTLVAEARAEFSARVRRPA